MSQVDSRIGHNLSRVLSNTVVGSRRSTEDEEAESTAEMEEDVENGEFKPQVKSKKYQVIGTLTNLSLKTDDELLGISQRGQMVETGLKEEDDKRRLALEKFSVLSEVPTWVDEVVPYDDAEAVKAAIIDSDYIIFDLTSNAAEAQATAEWLHSQAESFNERPKTLIVISTLMTWAKTRTAANGGDGEENAESSGALVEEDYRRRKPHPNFKSIWNAEKEIIKLGKKSSFKTFVISPGLIYHGGDSIFHPFLKAAWSNERELVVFGDGSNVLPTIHLDDLCEIVTDVIEMAPLSRYVVAVDGSSNTLLELVSSISEELGTGKVRVVPLEEAYLNGLFSQADIDMLTTSLRIEPGCVRDMAFSWKYESGLVENVAQFVQEYKNGRGLHPINVVVHGPPASGKTTLARNLANHYSLHYVDATQIMKNLVDELSARVSASYSVGESGGEGATGEAAGGAAGNSSLSGSDTHDIDEDRALLEDIKEFSSKNNGQYPPHLTRLQVRRRLLSKPCGNQGYVLDGYPSNIEEAMALFCVTEEESEEAGNDVAVAGANGESLPLNTKLQPGFVFGLDCTDQTVKERAMKLPEPDCLLYKNTQEGFLRRLEQYRAENTDENTILNFYDEHELLTISLNANPPNSAEQVTSQAKIRIGAPRNFGPKVEEIKRRRRIDEEERSKALAAQEEERQRQAVEEQLRQQKEYAEWKRRMEEIHSQEKQVLEAQSAPLRSYLMKNIMPTLSQALVQVCKVRPADPIDYVAEYLFKHGSVEESRNTTLASDK